MIEFICGILIGFVLALFITLSNVYDQCRTIETADLIFYGPVKCQVIEPVK